MKLVPLIFSIDKLKPDFLKWTFEKCLIKTLPFFRRSMLGSATPQSVKNISTTNIFNVFIGYFLYSNGRRISTILITFSLNIFLECIFFFKNLLYHCSFSANILWNSIFIPFHITNQRKSLTNIYEQQNHKIH